MTLTQIAKASAAVAEVSLDGDTLLIDSLAVTHPEAVALARKHVADHGADSLPDLVARALPIGVVSLTLGSAGMDSGSMQRTLDTFAGQVDAASTAALGELERATAALRAGEQDLATRAARVLERLPERVEAALAGEAANVRVQVSAAAAEVQASGLADIRTALAQHSEAVRNALSLDQEGPIRVLREEVLAMVDRTRAELGGQLSAVQALLAAAQAASTATAAAKSTRASGLAFESASMLMASEVVSAAGDIFDETGSRPAPGGGTSRVGDGVATLGAILTGANRTVRIVLEAKARQQGLTSVKWREELAASRDLRQASGAIGVVQSASQVPGGHLFARVGERLFVVVAEPQILALVYLVLRELCALAADRPGNDDTVEVAKAEARINQALAILGDLDAITRYGNSATKALEQIMAVSTGVKTRVEDALRDTLAALGSK